MPTGSEERGAAAPVPAHALARLSQKYPTAAPFPTRPRCHPAARSAAAAPTPSAPPAFPHTHVASSVAVCRSKRAGGGGRHSFQRISPCKTPAHSSACCKWPGQPLCWRRGACLAGPDRPRGQVGFQIRLGKPACARTESAEQPPLPHEGAPAMMPHPGIEPGSREQGSDRINGVSFAALLSAQMAERREACRSIDAMEPAGRRLLQPRQRPLAQKRKQHTRPPRKARAGPPLTSADRATPSWKPCSSPSSSPHTRTPSAPATHLAAAAAASGAAAAEWEADWAAAAAAAGSHSQSMRSAPALMSLRHHMCIQTLKGAGWT